MPDGILEIRTMKAQCLRSTSGLILRLGILLLGIACPAIALPGQHLERGLISSSQALSTSPPWYDHLKIVLGGHTKARGSVSWPDDDSFYGLVGTDPYYDGSAEFRCNAQLFFAQWGYCETAYETILFGGDTWRKGNKLSRLFPDVVAIRGSGLAPLDDRRRLFDLTKIVSRSESSVLYHRLDRLSVTLLPRWGTIRVGRQAVTWGNGLIFNPMDLFNPFAPTDIEREYKVGDDMANALVSINDRTEVELLYVVRRDPRNRSLTQDQTSLAGRLHLAVGTTELDIMGSRHYEDYIVGLGSTAYMKDAAWRLDATWTFLKGKAGLGGFLSLVGNIDYSWVWWAKNVYGLLEFYYSGVGEHQENYSAALEDPFITERLIRGELFTLGRFYLSGSTTIELHPLFNASVTVINNLADPSGIVQPRAIWDIAEDVQIIVGLNLLYGAKDTEYGGFSVPGTPYRYKAPDNAYLWISFYF